MTLDLDELERKAKAATPGPWGTTRSHPRNDSHGAWVEGPEACGYEGELPVADVEFIAAANPVTVLALIERVRELEALAKPLLDADLEPNEPYWPPEEDWDKSAEWCPVPGAARRALWDLRARARRTDRP